MSQSPCRIACPGDEHQDAEVRAIRARGNLPLLIGDRLLAEIERGDLSESWASAREMPAAKAARLASVAAARLEELLNDNLDSDDLAEVVSGAAVVFLTAMRKAGECDPARFKGCAVVVDGGSGTFPAAVAQD
jgi:predicted amino acid dehydrogenase